MSRSGTAVRPVKKPIVVLAGEDRNDRACLRIILEAFAPDLRGRIVEISDNVRLRHATGTTLDDRIRVLSRKVEARAAREHAEVAHVFIHEDMDAIDSPSCESTHQKVQTALDRHFATAYYTLAVWEIEAWLLLFPDAINAFNKTWRVPDKYMNKDTGLLADPKRVLKQEVSTRGRPYRESDAPDIFTKVVHLGRHLHPAGTNRSWQRIVQDAGRCRPQS